MSLIDKAKEFRNNIELLNTTARKLVKVTDIPAEDLKDLVNLYPKWEVGEIVKTGDVRRYYGKLYIVIQDHTTQEDWKPNATPALWTEFTVKIDKNGNEVVREIKENMLPTEAFKKDEKGSWKGKIYKSKIDSNVYTPTSYAAGWELISEV